MKDLKKKIIPLNIPYLKGSEKKLVLDCLRTNWVSSVGPYVTKFENRFKKFIGTKYAVACSSGTSALHLALLSLGIEEGDYMIVSNLTFIASVNSIKYSKASPILIDACKSSWQIDAKLLEKFLEKSCYLKNGNCFYKKNNRRVFGILLVHILGYSSNISKIQKVCKKYKIHLVEDAAEAFGAKYKQKFLGSIGVIGCFSFNGNKTITTGAGGMLVTNNKHLANLARHLSQQARVKTHDFIHDQIGYNYRMSNIHAALGLAQLENIQYILKIKKQNAQYYYKKLSKEKSIFFPNYYIDTKSSYWLNTIRLETNSKKNSTDNIIKYLLKKGIETRKLWQPMNISEPHKDDIYINNNDISKKLFDTCISLPSSVSLKKSEQDKVIHELIKVLDS